jgi:hypothetical protein
MVLACLPEAYIRWVSLINKQRVENLVALSLYNVEDADRVSEYHNYIQFWMDMDYINIFLNFGLWIFGKDF